MLRIENDALDRAYLDTLRDIVVTHAFGASGRGDLVDLDALADGGIRTDRLADIAIDALVGDLEGHGEMDGARHPDGGRAPRDSYFISAKR